MIFESYVPRPPLNSFIEFLWFHEGFVSVHTREKLLPDASMELIIDLQENPKKLYDRDDFSRFRSYKGSWISGQRREYIVIEAAQNSCMMGIHFRSCGAFPFFHFPLVELQDRVLDLEEVWGRRAAELRYRILESPTIRAKFLVLEDFLLQQGRGRLSEDPVLSFALKQMRSLPEALSMREIAKGTGISQKCLIQKFRDRVGLGPKLLSRVVKFQRVLELIQNQTRVSWSWLAQECGYYDQSHFIRDFQAFAGMNPSRYLVERSEHIHYVPLD